MLGIPKYSIKIFKTCVALLGYISVFLIFSNSFKKLCTQCGYAHGLLSDYLIPKLYLIDIFVFISVIMSIVLYSLILLNTHSSTHKAKLNTFFTILKNKMQDQFILHNTSLLWIAIGCTWILILLTQFVSLHPAIGVLQWLRITLYTGLIYVFVNYIGSIKNIILTLQLSMMLQLAIAWYQWLYQKTLFGYWFLGEPILTNRPGISRVIQNGEEYILPYGTTAHPNILGGLAAIVVLLSTYWIVSNISNYTSNNKIGTIAGFIRMKNFVSIVNFTSIRSFVQFLTKFKNANIENRARNMFSILAIISGLSLVWISQSASALAMLVVAAMFYFLYILKKFSISKVGLQYSSLCNSTVSVAFLAGVVFVISSTLVIATQWIGIQATQNPSLYRRAYLIETTHRLLGEQTEVLQTNRTIQFNSNLAPIKTINLIGTGLGQFTAHASQPLRAFESAQFNQPVHVVGLLFIAETGVLGLIVMMLGGTLLGYFIFVEINILQKKAASPKIIKNTAQKIGLTLIVLSPILLWDHYLLSIAPALYAGILFILLPSSQETN